MNRAARRRQERATQKSTRSVRVESEDDWIPAVPIMVGYGVGEVKHGGRDYVKLSFRVPGWGGDVLMDSRAAIMFAQEIIEVGERQGYAVVTGETGMKVTESGLVIP